MSHYRIQIETYLASFVFFRIHSLVKVSMRICVYRSLLPPTQRLRPAQARFQPHVRMRQSVSLSRVAAPAALQPSCCILPVNLRACVSAT